VAVLHDGAARLLPRRMDEVEGEMEALRAEMGIAPKEEVKAEPARKTKTKGGKKKAAAGTSVVQ